MKEKLLKFLVILLSLIVIYSCYSIYKNIYLLTQNEEEESLEEPDYFSAIYKDTTESSVSFIKFNEDKTFNFTVNDCNETKEISGTYILEKDKITLSYNNLNTNQNEYFIVDGSGDIIYNGIGFGCFPKENENRYYLIVE